MPLNPGAKIGPYEILSALGVGGMGEVYRARDTKLNRDVAIKVLPDALRRDPERLARFEREAQVLAALNHPHIAHIHGFDDSTDVPALVMELVEGPTLADRIGQGPVPVVEALAIATQIADALEAAHERGIVHRDLKPANIKVRDDGTVKVLDFGLAKALDPSATSTASAMNSPTLMAKTLHGVILGTAAYMSPEQARGKTVDRRTDIWAFGCVLFEMLVGRQAFAGETVSDTIGAILNKEPDWGGLAESTPASVRTLLRRCLAKDRAQRLRDIGDAKLALDEVGLQSGVKVAADRVTPSSRVLIAAVVAALALGAATRFIGRQETRGPAVVRFQIPLGPSQSFPVGTGGGEAWVLALSPDARRIAFVLTDGIHVRSIDQIDERRLPGTEGGQSPAFSPDGESLIFRVGLTNGSLKTVRLSGGAPLDIPGTPRGDTPGWDAAGIVYGVNQGMDGVHFLPSGTTAPERVTKPDPAGGGPHRRAQLLPDPDKVLFTVQDETPHAAVASRKTGTWHLLDALGEASDAHYLRSGYLVFGRGQEILAVRFDPESLQAIGPPVVVATGARTFSLSDSGSLAYTGANLSTLVWVDRRGFELGVVGKPENVNHPRVSPDGRHLAMLIDSDIWTVDLERGGRVKLTTGGGNFDPTWQPAAETPPGPPKPTAALFVVT
jgi:serine/threonine-protein kinase